MTKKEREELRKKEEEEQKAREEAMINETKQHRKEILESAARERERDSERRK